MSGAGASDAPPGTRLQLEVVAGNAAGSMIGVDERLVFGRQSEGEGKLADDPELSRHHAEITRRPTGEYALEDLSSTNGTFVNGARLSEPLTLSLNDAIELGTTKLVVRALPAVTAPADGGVDVRAATVTVDVPAAVRAPAEPEPEPEPEPAPPPSPPPAPAPPPPLVLRLKVDLARAEAEIALGEGESVRLRLQEEGWRIADGDAT